MKSGNIINDYNTPLFLINESNTMMETFANLEMLRSGKQLEIKCIINKFNKKNCGSYKQNVLLCFHLLNVNAL